MSENNKGNVENIINFYMNSNDKGKAINELSIKYELSERRIYQILKDNQCLTPREFKKRENTEAITKHEQDTKKEITTTISKKLREYGYKDKAEIERRVNLVKYIQETTGIDVCEEFDKFLVSFIESIESNQLYVDIESIKKGTNIFERYNISGELQSLANRELEEMVKNVFPDKKNQEKVNQLAKEKQREKDIMSTGVALCMINPNLYRIYCMAKGYGDPLKHLAEDSARLRKAIDILNRVNESKKEESR